MPQILDDNIGKTHPAFIVAKTGTLLPTPAIFAGYVCLALGIISIVFVGIIPGVSVSVLGAFLSFSYYGVKIDTANKRLNIQRNRKRVP